MGWSGPDHAELADDEAVHLLGVDQPKVSKLLRGHFRSISSDKLIPMLSRLGQDVVITIVPSTAVEQLMGHTGVGTTQGM